MQHATSAPWIRGNDSGSRRHPALDPGSSAEPYAPSLVQMSVLFNAVAPTRTSTSPGPGNGSGRSSRYSNISGPPNPVSSTPRTLPPPTKPTGIATAQHVMSSDVNSPVG